MKKAPSMEDHTGWKPSLTQSHDYNFFLLDKCPQNTPTSPTGCTYPGACWQPSLPSRHTRKFIILISAITKQKWNPMMTYPSYQFNGTIWENKILGEHATQRTTAARRDREWTSDLCTRVLLVSQLHLGLIANDISSSNRDGHRKHRPVHVTEPSVALQIRHTALLSGSWHVCHMKQTDAQVGH